MISENAYILGGPFVNLDTLCNKLKVISPKKTEQDRSRICSAYTSFGNFFGISNVLAFEQGCKESDFFLASRFILGNNPVGIGSVDNETFGDRFPTIEAGIFAQFVHLYNYAVMKGKGRASLEILRPIDTRLEDLRKKEWIGIAPRWIDLNGRWASPGTDYGNTIIKRANIRWPNI